MLKTKRLILRTAQQSDLDDLFAVYSNADAMKYWSSPVHGSKDETQKLLTLQIDHAKSRAVYFVIELDGQAVGQIGLHGLNEIGFILHPAYWGKGIISEAAEVVIPYLFETMRIERLTADVDPNNPASIATLQKFGFKETHRAKKTFFINGVWSDSVYFELKRL